MKLVKHLFLIVITLSLFSCNGEEDVQPLIDPEVQAEREDQAIQQYLAENNLTAQKTDLGIYYIVLEEGQGNATPNVGANVEINYTGRVLYGRRFDSSYERGEPLRFTIGSGSVVVGFEQATRQMNLNETTRFFIPSRYAYGQQGITTAGRQIIPPFATLIFDIKLERF